MATIRPNVNAPDDQVRYCLGSVVFELAPGGEFETDDRAAIADAAAHPWLDVELPQAEELSEAYVSKSVPYEDDVLAAPNSQAFDPDKVHEMQMERERDIAARTAIDAGLDQGEVVEAGGVNLTHAAAEEDAERPVEDDDKSSDDDPKENE